MPRKRRGLDWRGLDVYLDLQDATQEAIDDTMAKCVDDAKRNVPVVTATLQGSIRLKPAEQTHKGLVGEWGSFDVNYALAVETGNRSLVGPPHRSTTPGSRTSGAGRNTGNRNFLRNAADKEYPKLAARIRSRLRRQRRSAR